ncbi:hypothetical protein [Curtobacterium sp. 9128]|nr:hypothetical protein [Curtobacterium sp. 9128]
MTNVMVVTVREGRGEMGMGKGMGGEMVGMWTGVEGMGGGEGGMEVVE